MIKIDIKRFIYERVWFGYNRVAIYTTQRGHKHEHGEWKWKWVKVT